MMLRVERQHWAAEWKWQSEVECERKTRARNNIYSRHSDSGQVECKVGFVAVQATAAFSLTVEIELCQLRLRMCVRECG